MDALYSNKNKKIEISEEFIKAKILLTNNKNAEAAIYFKNIIDKKDKTYSPLSLFIIIDKNLESNREIISKIVLTKFYLLVVWKKKI